MSKYAGIPAELEAPVQALIEAALAAQEQSRSKTTLEADNGRLKEQLAARDGELQKATEKVASLEADKVALTNQANEKEAALIVASKELETLREEKVEAELADKIEATWKKLAEAHGFDEKDAKLKAAKLDLVTKLAAGKESLTLEEHLELVKGGKPQPVEPRSGMRLVASAGGASAEVDRDQLKRAYPSFAASVEPGRRQFR